jgi:hypothetical protein
MCPSHLFLNTVADNRIAPQDALIVLCNNDACQLCGDDSPDRGHYACPECSYIFCGFCAILEPLAARMAECPGCHLRFPWPQ